MRSIVHLIVGNLGWLVVGTLAASLSSLVYSVIQVRKNLKLLQKKREMEIAAMRITLAQGSDTAQHWGENVEARQKVSDEPRKHSEVFAPSGQNMSTPSRAREPGLRSY
jgi:hypothetical protein